MSVRPTLDRRQEKTRQAIVAAFLDLLFEQSYPALTMAAVAARANVGRSTLYEHFRTKPDLLKHTLSAPFGDLAAAIEAGTATPELTALLQHFRDHQGLGRVLFAPPTRGLLQKVLVGQIETRLEATAIPSSLMASQIAAAQLALLEPWILGQVALSADIMAEAVWRSSRALISAMTATKAC